MTSEDVRLVVDTSIIRAAGDRPENRSRAALAAILESAHSVVRSQELAEEWRRHLRSAYSMGWLVEMAQRRRIDDVGDVHDPALRTRLEASLGNQAHNWPMMLKDAHQVEAALVTGMRVLSLDDKVRKHFQTACRAVTGLARILWANPHGPDEGVPAWIASGTPREAARQLDPSA